MTADKGVERALQELPKLDRKILLSEFRKLWGAYAPKNISRHLLELAVAYKIQENVYGGLKPSVRRAMLSGDFAATKKTSTGTMLVREWQGVPHTVTILADGVLYRDQKYRSLTQVTEVITGAHRSGPIFFGLKRQKKRP